MSDDLETLKKAKDNAYWERNQLVSALSKLYPSFLTKHPENEEWEDDWLTIVVVYIPAGDIILGGQDMDIHRRAAISFTETGKDWWYQLTWHIHDTDVPMFDHLTYNHPFKADYWYDGHTTEEKYRRLRTLRSKSD